MSKAAQQRVIEEHQATIKRLREEVRQAKVNERDATNVFKELIDLCDEYEANRLSVVPVSILRRIRPSTHGVQGGQPLKRVETITLKRAWCGGWEHPDGSPAAHPPHIDNTPGRPERYCSGDPDKEEV